MSVARRTDIIVLLAVAHQQVVHAFNVLLITCGHRDERACLRLLGAGDQRRVNEPTARSLDLLMQFACGDREGRGGVNDDLATHAMFEELFDRRLNDIRVRQRQEHDLAIFKHLDRRSAQSRHAGEGFHRLGVQVVHAHIVSLGNQVFAHALSHVAETNKAYLAHNDTSRFLADSRTLGKHYSLGWSPPLTRSELRRAQFPLSHLTPNTTKTPKQNPPMSIHTSVTMAARPGENSCSVSSMSPTATPQRSKRLQGLFRRSRINVSTTPSAANSSTCASFRRRPSPAPISVVIGSPARNRASQPLISLETEAGNSEFPQIIRRMRMTTARSLLLSLGN